MRTYLCGSSAGMFLLVKDLYIQSNLEMLELDSNIQSNLEKHASSQCRWSNLGICAEDCDIHYILEIDVEYSDIQSNKDMLDLDSNIRSIQEMHASSHCM